ncbi:MAG: hypothetical protein AAGC55_34515, partial [Myxococcota bacterium]
IDVASGRARVLAVHDRGYRSVVFADSGDRLVAGSVDGMITLWQLDSGAVTRLAAGDYGEIAELWLSEGRLLARSTDQFLRGWDLSRSGTPLFAYRAPGPMAVSDDGLLAAFADGDTVSLVRLSGASPGDPTTGVLNRGRGYAPESADPSAAITLPAEVRFVRLTGRGRRLVAYDIEENLWVIDVASQKVTKLGSVSNQTPFPMAISPSGRWLATRGPSQTGQLWDLESGATRLLYGHDSLIYTIAFAPDESFVVTGGDDASARIWRLDSSHTRVLRGHMDDVVGAVVAPGGQAVVSLSRDRSIRVWPTASGSEIILSGVDERLVAGRFVGDNEVVSA